LEFGTIPSVVFFIIKTKVFPPKDQTEIGYLQQAYIFDFNSVDVRVFSIIVVKCKRRYPL
jgi:hypothetical protein